MNIREQKLREFLVEKAKECKTRKDAYYVRFMWYNNWLDDRSIEFYIPEDLEYEKE